ncbi:hypothetical protein DPM19_09075 [Actinomadura craniellae]|uniref:Putative restriction endonuclease domain-containing protein n=1 Tax=Actinomadura craniellae TaxID=2231787 RepID=A0A365H9X7_9ACTN|nr:Uma2 family endonuclease [Actinomadura craniellae]RAY15897.1 hypothetical protein DPM19_09075 [Actinomadura craniellae]
MSVTVLRQPAVVLPDSAYAMWARGELGDFLHVPEGHRVEVIGGEVVVSPAPVLEHGGIVQDITRAVFRAAAADPAFPWEAFQGVGLDLFGVRDGYIPDLVVMDGAAFAAARAAGVRHLVPDQVELVVEVTSPSNAADDRRSLQDRRKATKWSGYARSEVPYYLLADRDPKVARTTLFSIPDQGAGAYLHEESWEFGELVRLPDPFGIEIDTTRWRTWDE